MSINNDVIDRINNNRIENHILNLNWCIRRDKNHNKSSQYELIIVNYHNGKNERRVFDENKYYYYHKEETDENTY